VNHILQGTGWETISDYEKIFPDLSYKKKGMFLDNLEAASCLNIYKPTDQEGETLTVKIQSGKRITDSKNLIVFELISKGQPISSNIDDIQKWFHCSHDTIMTAFENLTSEQMQKSQWGKQC
ncbi:MAG: hypothetical protein D4R81_05215, partial [Nitrospiraceae bacterium]